MALTETERMEAMEMHEKNQYDILKSELESFLVLVSKSVALKKGKINEPSQEVIVAFRSLEKEINQYIAEIWKNDAPKDSEGYQAANQDLVDLLDRLTKLAATISLTGKLGQEDRVTELQSKLEQITPSYTAPKQPNPLERAQKVVADYRAKTAGSTHPMQTLILRDMRDSVFGENQEHSMRDIMKNLIANRYESSADESLRSKVKISLRSMFQRSKNHPEIRVLKLLSEFKEGNQPEDHKHNHQILQQISELVKRKDANTARSSTSANAAQFLLELEKFTDLSKNREAKISELAGYRSELNTIAEKHLTPSRNKTNRFKATTPWSAVNLIRKTSV